MADALLDDLNPHQRQGATTTEGPLLLLAGAGAGKTRVLTRRLAYLVREGLATPQEILAVTFTNKAAKEMSERVHALLDEKGGKEQKGLWVLTFHSLCVRIIRQSGHLIDIPKTWSIVDADDTRTLIRQAMKALYESDEAPEAREVRRAQRSISRYKNANMDIDDVDDGEIAEVWRAYEEKLAEVQGLDFDDLLIKTVEILETPKGKEKWCQRWSYMLVDEVQDVNLVQDRIMTLLAEHNRNLCVVGDDSQAIYAFRGSDVEHIMNFEERWPGAKVINLEQNYRSTPEILEAANAVIEHNVVRLDKILRPVRDTGSPVVLRHCARAWDEAEAIVSDFYAESLDPEHLAIIYRTNAQSRVFEDVFNRNGLPYHVVGGLAFLMRAEIKTARAYLQLALHPRDRLAFRRAIENPRRGVGPTAQAALHAFAVKNKMSLLQASVLSQSIKGVSAKAAVALKEFASMYGDLLVDSEQSLQEVMEVILRRGGYVEYLRKGKDEDALANIGELISLLSSYDTPPDPEDEEPVGRPGWLGQARKFLEYASLGDVSAEAREGITLMTMHATKGLEFPRVYLVGLEDGLFFHGDDNEKDIEEGRRLLYVGMTRAEEKLVMSYCDERMQWGRVQMSQELRFLEDLPDSVVQEDLRAWR